MNPANGYVKRRYGVLENYNTNEFCTIKTDLNVISTTKSLSSEIIESLWYVFLCNATTVIFYSHILIQIKF